jgi:hypothetical protein
MSARVKADDRVVDQAELQVHRIFIIALFLTAYFLDRWELVALQAVVLLITSLNPGYSPYIALYRNVLQPTGLIRPDRRLDNNEAHRFAAVIGALTSSCAVYFLMTGRTSLGWGLVWLIVVLAGVACTGWCAGCFVYYMLNRLGLKGFFKYAAIGGAFPGSRPSKIEWLGSQQGNK